MKLRFRAELKDIKIFIAFAILLFYLVAIAMLNIVEFINTSTLHGFNPLPIFSSDLIGPAIVFYIAALVMIIVSVKSYFFEREKGVGIKTEKKEESGYSRWAKEDEIKKELKKIDPRADSVDAGGIALINTKKEMWVDDSEYHSLIIGATGSGKTQIIVQPLVKILAKHGESMIITDPKGEIYEKNAVELREKGYNVVLLNFRNPQMGNAWNPLALPYHLYKEHNSDKAIELLDDLALNILYDESSKNQDPFWEKTSADYFSGLALALFDDAKEEEINLNSINIMTTVGEQRVGGSTYVKEYFADKDPAGPAYTNASSTLIAPQDTKGSILSVFKQKIKLFASRENISEMLSHSDFDMKDIGRQKTAVFLVVQDEKKTYHPLLTIFLKQCYETLIDVAQENGGQLPFRTNFILDEFANMPPLKDVTTMITASRSRKIRFNFIIQNFSQLTEVYGEHNGETIKGNCGNIIYLISSELKALEELSKLAGEKKSKKEDKTVSTPLVTVSDLQRMKFSETVILRLRKMPFKTKLTPNFEMVKNNMWGKEYPKSEYPVRERRPVQIFDLKGFVDAKVKERRDKMFGANPNAMGNNGRPVPPMFPGGMGPNPMPNPGMQNRGPNIDEMLKRIEAQIEEIEKGEGKTKSTAKVDEKSPVEIKMEKTTEEKAPTPKFNMDKFLERVDTRIAELEKEEQLAKEKETQAKEKQQEPAKIKSVNDVPRVDNKPKIKDEKEIKENKVVQNEQPIVEKVEETKKEDKEINKVDDLSVNNKDYITDDQFFDDFFSDEEE